MNVIDTVAELARDTEEDCREVRTVDIAQRLAWLDRAAAAGSESAQADYVTRALGVLTDDPQAVVRNAEEIVRVKTDGIRYLEAAAARGNTRALFSLAIEYRGNVTVPPDKVLGLGYLLALQQTGLAPDIGGPVARWSGELSDDELARAHNQARRIFASCCAP
ncbi:MAG: hypothetical protein ABI881_08965 [Betaproteobacteria bacterium]